jgi:ATP-binding cassette, subfamily B, bacterial
MRGQAGGGGGGRGIGRLANAPDEIPPVTWALFKRVLGYTKKYQWTLILILFMLLVITGLGLVSPLIFRQIIDHVLPDKNIQKLLLWSAALLLIPAIRGILNVIQNRLVAGVGEGVIYDLRMALYSGLQRMSLRFFTNTKVGELMSRLNNDVVGAQNAISRVLVDMITNLIQAGALMVVMLSLEWRLALISIAILPLFLYTARQLAKRLRVIVRRQLQSNAEMNVMMNETLNIGGALLVKLFGRKTLEVDRFGGRAKQVRDSGIERAYVGSIFMMIAGLVTAVGTAFVYGFGGYLVIQGSFSVGTIVAFGSYLVGLYSAFQSLFNAPVDFAISVVSFERVFEVLDLPIEIDEKPDALDINSMKGEIVFDNVSFTYKSGDENFLAAVQRYGSMDTVTALNSSEPGKAEPVQHSQARGSALENINFCVDPGKLVALVGPSGAGKTTLTYLIPRLYDPTSGSIRIDGHDLRDVSLDSLSSQIGMVTQESYLFHDSIRTNLLYARLNATQQQLEDACKAANIHDFISELPDQYDTIVGERGYRLSGGEKQRVALARVILKDPKILVLDEATSSLDSESEALIQDALKRVMKNRTSIVIAHRLSTILAADMILVLDRGKIVEQGTHKQLLTLKGLYAQLYKTQFRENRQIEETALN